jgi:glycosyltransferase involved in cell wall biosynthesis
MHDFELRPRLGRVRGKDNRRFLLVCYFDPSGVATVCQYIGLWQRASRFQIDILNLWPSSRCIPGSVTLNEFDGCILHSTVSYNPDQLVRLDQRLKPGFAEYDGVKVLIKQDEHRRANEVRDFIAANAFDLLITCVPRDELEKVYPRSKVGEIRFIHAFTGYVSPSLRDFAVVQDYHRILDISYRGSIQPLSVGRLGLEKRKIGYDVTAACAGRGLDLDISSRWEDRIGGTGWFDFLARSKAVLGVESGSNLFDFTGEVEAWCDEFCRRNRDKDQLSELFYRSAYHEYLKDFEENVNYAQISPRHFEAAATRTLQILYEGEYSGILRPFRHFVPLRRDLANLDDVLEVVRDERRRREITEAAFDEVVADPRYRYERFVAGVDEAIAAALTGKGRLARPRPGVVHRQARALLLMPHEPVADPRIEWMAEGLARDYLLCEIGTYRFNEHGAGPSLQRISDRRYRVRVERNRHDWDWVPPPYDGDGNVSAAARQLALLFMYARLPERALRRVIGAHDADAAVLERFRQLCTYFVNTNGALIEAARLIGSFDVIIAADLESLPAALILGGESKGPVVYDAHEYWPYSYHDFRHWETEFWSGLERALVKVAAIRVTVSPPLAALLSADYGCEFIAVPNCTTVAGAAAVDVQARLRQRTGGETVFLYQGSFAPGRGIEHLISAWAQVASPARLLLRGPPSPFKREMEYLAQSLGLKGRRVVFPEPVTEDELIAAAGEADVGIIPYEPDSPNNKFSCPNKLSQYLAAGLPIITNELDFVQQVVLENRLGAVVGFRDAAKLAQTVERFSDRDLLAEMSPRAQAFFQTTFHWEAVSAGLFRKIAAVVGSHPRPARAELDFSWIAAGRDMRTLAMEAFLANPPIPVAVPMSAATSAPDIATSAAAAVMSGSARLRRKLLNIVLDHRTRRIARTLVGLLPDRMGAVVKTKLVLALWHLY